MHIICRFVFIENAFFMEDENFRKELEDLFKLFKVLIDKRLPKDFKIWIRNSSNN